MKIDRLAEIKTWLGYDDVAILPQYSEIRTRKNINLSSVLDEKLNIVLKAPIIASPMNTVCETEMCVALDKLGGLGILHRYNTPEQQLKMYIDAKSLGCVNIGAAVGVSGDYLNRVHALYNAGCKIICIDVAHGHNILMKEAIYEIRKIVGNNVHLMAGNVGTESGALFLDRLGVNSIRVGISTGSICSTNASTAIGTPIITAIHECVSWDMKAKIIADGGVKSAGDICKALAMHADFVMCGSMFAGTMETPGDIIELEGKSYKKYSGMASREAKQTWDAEKIKAAPEGISSIVPYRGPVNDIWNDLTDNIRSGLSYVGANNIAQFRNNARLIQISQSAKTEMGTHILNRKF